MGLNPDGTRNSHTSCPGLWTRTVFQNCTGTSWATAETREDGSRSGKTLLKPSLAGSRREKEDGRGRGTWTWPGAGWWTAARPAGIKVPGPPVGMHGHLSAARKTG